MLDIDCLVPHRFPFLLVDKVTGYKSHEWIEGIKRISCNDYFSYLYSPLLLCESLAQLSKILETLSHPTVQKISYLTSLQIECYDPAEIGDEIQLLAVQKKKFQDMMCYRVEALIKEKQILAGTLFRKVR